MSDIAIKVENLPACAECSAGRSKRYRIGLREEMHETFVGALTHLLTRPVQNLRRLRRLTRFDDPGPLANGNPKSEIQNPESDDILWALPQVCRIPGRRDVSFEVQRGEVVGIIGCLLRK